MKPLKVVAIVVNQLKIEKDKQLPLDTISRAMSWLVFSGVTKFIVFDQ